MELSLREAATLLGCSPRTLRDRLARGDLTGSKRNGAWRIHRRDLPLTDRQRERLAARAEDVRAAVDRALPRLHGEPTGRRSVLALEPVRHLRRLLHAWSALDPLPDDVDRSREHVHAALAALCRGAHAFEPGAKVAAFRDARTSLSLAVAALLAETDESLAPDRASWIEDLEARALATLGGLLRWSESLQRGKRRGG